MHELIERGAYEPNLERIRGLLRLRRDAMLGRRSSASSGARGGASPSGYFLWLDLPADARELLTHAESAGITFVTGADFFPGGKGRRSARLAFSYSSPSEIDEGVSILASSIMG